MTVVTPPTPTVITRAWHDIAPKLLAYLATGLTGSAVVAILAALNITVAPGFAAAIVVGISAVAGYFVHDTVPPAS